jgi:hypothetical protein
VIRHQGWINANYQAYYREEALQVQLDELQAAYHHLNNLHYPMHQPIPRYLVVHEPQVIEADEEEENA